ncbi:ceramidase domain-containing protein [Vannielia litorea]|uniref:Ceramidase n=1 Tax=Vannielia litorea TaxID=1217970 RepID=A0A1N6ERV9_9RHOB|nr:ceramidase domain-containing protein [Vannielia litorea]SIN85852.1 Ceramidase [Vannielia litorea]
MDWTAPIDGYCERLSPAFWAEPVNALTNAAFLLAALVALLHARRIGQARGAVTVLCLLLAAIGMGSLAFHTFATRWAALADVVPIQLFSLVALVAGLHRFTGAQGRRTALLVPPVLALLIGATWGLALIAPPLLRGAVGYAPAFLSLWGFAALTAAQRSPPFGRMATAALVFTASLTARTLDGPLCAVLPLGTHWLWHLANAVTLALVIGVLARQGALLRRRQERRADCPPHGPSPSGRLTDRPTCPRAARWARYRARRGGRRWRAGR